MRALAPRRPLGRPPGRALRRRRVAAAATAGAPPPAPHPSTWSDWLAAFDANDDDAEAAARARDDLAAAVAAQDFAAAAAAKRALDALAARDGVAQVSSAVSAAVAAEDYATAAALAEAGATRLVGWWAAAPSADDPGGHLLRIAPSFGAYAGEAFRADDLADLADPDGRADRWGGGPDPASAAGADGVLTLDASTSVADGVNTLEVLVRAPVGGLPAAAVATQAAVVRPSFYDDAFFAPSPSPSPASSSSSRGSVAVSVTPVSSPGAGGPLPSGAGVAMRIDVSVTAAPDADAADADASDDETGLEAVARARAGGVRVETADDAAAASSDDDRDDDDDDDDDDSPYRLAAAAAAVFDVERAPAGITWHGPDAFTVHAGGWGDDDGEGDDAGAAAASRQTVTTSFDAAVPSSSSSTASMDAFEAAADAAAVDVARHVRAAADAAGGGPLPLTEEELADYVRAALTNAMDGEVAVAGAIESDDDDDDDGGGASSAASPLSEAEAEAAAAATGFITAAGGVSVVATGPSAGLVGDVVYTRLPCGPPSPDPFDGLYIGSFGPDGPELVRLARGGADAPDTAVAVRIASDGAPALAPRAAAARPARAATAAAAAAVPGARFTVSTSRRDRLPVNERDGPYPPELGVRARYRGTAYVGGPLGAAPVEGELLLFSGRAPVTRGAAMGFVWGGDRRHLVLLTRVVLADPAKRPEWYGTRGPGAYGRNDGVVVLEAASQLNGRVTVTAHPCSSPPSREWRVLRFNDTRQSVAQVALDGDRAGRADPGAVAFEYCKTIVALALALLPPPSSSSSPPSILCLGVGGATIPLALAAAAGPTARVVGVEKDAAVLAALPAMGVPAPVPPGVSFVCDDAESYVAGAADRGETVDLAIVDCFDGDDAVPPALLAPPFLASLAARLHPAHGAVLINLHCGPGPPVWASLGALLGASPTGPRFDAASPAGAAALAAARAVGAAVGGDLTAVVSARRQQNAVAVAARGVGGGIDGAALAARAAAAGERAGLAFNAGDRAGFGFCRV